MITMQTLLLCLVFSLVSCSSDNGDSDGSQTQSGQTHSTSTWYFADDDLSSYIMQIKNSCNSDPSNYYRYVSNDGGMNCLGSFSAIEIINKNTLKMWYFSYGIVGCKPSLDSEYYIPTNYTIGSDKIISFSTYSSMYTYVENEGKIIVTNGDIYTTTPQGLIRDGSSTILKKKTINIADFKEEKQTVKDCQNKANTTLTADCDYETFICHVAYNSALNNIHPKGTFVYGVEYGLKNSTLEIYETGNCSFNGDVLIEGNVEYNMFIGSWLALETKLQNGETLTQSEKSLYINLTNRFDELRNKAKQNFIVKGYVRYGGVKYYID